MSKVITMGGLRRKLPGHTPDSVQNLVYLLDGSGLPEVIGYVERELPPGGVPAYLAARKKGARTFALWTDAHRRDRVATVVTQSATGGVSTFQVLGVHGELIGTIVREKAFRGRGVRTRWTVTPAGAADAVGYKGRILWWFVWWLCLPVMVLLLIVSIFDSTPGEGGAARAPRRIRWRAGGEMPLEFRSGGDKLHLHAPGLDWRLGAALVSLVRSFGSHHWDAMKK
ncbi:hypothetical protein ACFY9Y_26495 [Streptomyces fimicarius]|uniref:N-acetyltransferase domain-containing protein n=1 Tax=Streptomyces caviscabies TaxID=90079 RepID=A0ABW2MQU6_9ACTN|nr:MULTISPECIES: hypothetical protein [unclassified Streptomyces]MDX3342778.1 hypothetical protein [Streptomyces sp. ME02-6979.5a]MDX3506275.1 hypothetical protein [Streptomyces sp. ATCC51928]MDX5525670.1 hypothetical protein [Streptomyces sp. DE06-01C]